MNVVLIAGPTASGKSGAAIGVAQAKDGVIINADSMQVYHDLQVLTSRPSRHDESKIEHCLYGYLSGAERCSVARWLGDADKQIKRVLAEGRTPVVVGGTGLYFKALEFGLAPVPEIDETIRQTLRQQLHDKGPETLHAVLAKLDEISAERLKVNDSQRIIRALEVVQSTGKPLWHFHEIAAQSSILSGQEVQKLALAPARDKLYARINQRFDEMMKDGALDEVKHLRGLGLQEDLPVMKAIGVRSLGAYLDGLCDLDEAIDKAKQETRNYAKRQMTWQRGQMAGWANKL